MAYFPNVEDENVQSFEGELTRALREAAPTEIVGAVLKACVYIEKFKVRDGDTFNRVNNATSTFVQSVTTLAARTVEAEARLKKVTEWVTGDVVTADTEFGEGYRECMRDLRDKLGIKKETA